MNNHFFFIWLICSATLILAPANAQDYTQSEDQTELKYPAEDRFEGKFAEGTFYYVRHMMKRDILRLVMTSLYY
jgi:hypothetical protein